jgi:hypothetical protein
MRVLGCPEAANGQGVQRPKLPPFQAAEAKVAAVGPQPQRTSAQSWEEELSRGRRPAPTGNLSEFQQRGAPRGRFEVSGLSAQEFFRDLHCIEGGALQQLVAQVLTPPKPFGHGGRDDYQRAMTTCLEARGYGVR